MKTAFELTEVQRGNQTRKVKVPVWDDYFQKEEIVPGVQKIFKEPRPMANERDFGFARVYHQPKHHTLDIMPQGCNKISDTNILKIANSFNIDQVKVKVWRGGAYPNGDISRYELSYGEKCYNWNDETLELLNTIPCDLEYRQVLCYGITEYGEHDNTIIHTEPIVK